MLNFLKTNMKVKILGKSVTQMEFFNLFLFKRNKYEFFLTYIYTWSASFNSHNAFYFLYFYCDNFLLYSSLWILLVLFTLHCLHDYENNIIIWNYFLFVISAHFLVFIICNYQKVYLICNNKRLRSIYTHPWHHLHVSPTTSLKIFLG